MASHGVIRVRSLILSCLLYLSITSSLVTSEVIQLEGYHGIISSPNYPHPYPINTDVQWNIVVPEGRRVRLTFVEFDLEESWECESDVITIGNEQAAYCGNVNSENAPPTSGVISSGSNMTVSFHSDHSDLLRFSGFRAIYTAEDINECESDNGGCVHHCHNYIGGFYCSCREDYLLHEDGQSCVAQCAHNILSELTGVIQTPEYPDPYPGYSDCDWTIDVAEGYIIMLTFNDFDIENHPDEGCPYDSLMIEADNEITGPFCGTETDDWPLDMTSSGHSMKITFHSDKDLGKRGFKARYTTIPKPCEQIEAPTYGSIFLLEMSFNQVATFQCNNGYEVVGSSERACLADGSWSGVMPICTGVDCGKPVEITNGQVNSATNNFTFTNTISYQCNHLYRRVGVESRVCQADGTWSDPQPYCEPICGKSVVPPREEQRGRIVGGQEASEGSWPWMAFIEIRAPSFGLNSHFCGGSLLNEEWILTAAHCITGMDDSLMSRGLYGASVPPDQVNVKLGMHDRNQLSDVEQRTFDYILRPPNYVLDLYDADLALMHLTEPVILTERIRPICLPGDLADDNEDDYSSVDDTQEVTEEEMGIIMGWGRLNEGSITSDTLQEAYVPLVENDVCQLANQYTVTDHMICAGFEDGGRDSCQGDSGGPMVLPTEIGSFTYFIKGISSWGVGCARVGKYGVYSKVENFVDWIKENTEIDRTVN